MDSENTTGKKTMKRRRILKVSSAAMATGTGIIGTAAGKHNPDVCPRSDQCDGYITFDDQSVGSDCDGDIGHSVTVQEAYLPCGGYVDIHNPDRNKGPTGTHYKAGYPLGATCYLPPQDDPNNPYTDLCIDLYEGNCAFGTCITWPNNTDEKLDSSQDLLAMLHFDDPNDELFTHYCDHIGPKEGQDHAYLCDQDGDGDLEPIKDIATVTV